MFYLIGEVFNENLSLRAFTDEDMELFASWLNKGYILKWYHNPKIGCKK